DENRKKDQLPFHPIADILRCAPSPSRVEDTKKGDQLFSIQREQQTSNPYVSVGLDAPSGRTCPHSTPKSPAPPSPSGDLRVTAKSRRPCSPTRQQWIPKSLP